MVKFGKYLESNSLPGYIYINYKTLKQTLNEIYVKLKTSNNKTNASDQLKQIEKEISLEEHEINSVRESEGTKSLDSRYNNKFLQGNFLSFKRELLKKFTTLLNSEIRKFYCFFLEKEKEMFQMINLRLHKKNEYPSFSIVDFVREIEELYRLGILADSTNRYVIINLQCIKKILKKFDKKTKEFFINTSISVKYIRSKLKPDNKDNDINYILKFKLIDEIATLMEYLANELNGRVGTLREENVFHQKDMKEIDSSNDMELKAVLLNEAKNNCYIIEFKRKFNVFFKGVENMVASLNNLSLFRVNPLETKGWMLKESNIKMSSSEFITSLEEGSNRNIVHMQDNEFFNIIQLFVPEEAYRSLIKDHDKIISQKNLYNKNVLLFHSFLYSFIYAMIISGLPIFLQLNNDTPYLKDLNPALSGIGFIVIHLGMLTNKATISFCFNSKRNYLATLLISVVASVVAVCLFFYFKSNFNLNIYLLYPILFFIGFGISGELHSRYFKDYLPKVSYDNLIFYQKLLGVIGFSLGIALLFLFDYVIIMVVVLLVLTSFWFSNPKSSSFSQMNTQLALLSGSENMFNPGNEREQEQEREKVSSIFEPNFSQNPNEKKDKDSDEEIRIHRANEGLKKVNEENKYNFANVIPAHMTIIINTVKSSHQTIFNYISIHILFNNLINFSALFLLMYYFMDNNFNDNKQWLPYLFLIPFLSNYIVDLVLFPLLKKWKIARQRNVLIVLQIVLIAWCLFFVLSIYEPDLTPQKNFDDNRLWKIIFVIYMTLTNYLFEFFEKDYINEECAVKSKLCRREDVLGEIGKLTGVIVPGIVKLLTLEPPSEEEEAEPRFLLKFYLFFHLVLYLMMFILFIGGFLMKIVFSHKLVHRLIKEKFYN